MTDRDKIGDGFVVGEPFFRWPPEGVPVEKGPMMRVKRVAATTIELEEVEDEERDRWPPSNASVSGR